MSIEHAKTKRSLFDFEGLTENTVAPAPSKIKKKKERIPFYIKALDKISSNLNIETAENTVVVEAKKDIFVKNEIIYDDLKLPEDAQVVQPKQPPEGSYESIWKKPRIRPNVDFEEEMDQDEEFDFDDEEELDCAIEAPSIKINRHIYHKYFTQPETQPLSAPEEPQEETSEDTLKAPAVQEEPIEEEPVEEKTCVPGPAREYVEVVDELHGTIRKMKKDPLLEHIELCNTSLRHKSINDLYSIKEERITNEPINEV